MNRLKLHTPTENELEYRRQLIADETTMSYNAGYGDNGGCTYHQTDMQVRQWYQSWNKDNEHFYAYIVRTQDNTYIGEVNAHKGSSVDWYEMGIVLEAKYRGLGYAVEALNLLLKYVFETLGAKSVHNDFEETRTAAVRTHLSAGFTEYAKHDGIIELLITKEQYDRL